MRSRGTVLAAWFAGACAGEPEAPPEPEVDPAEAIRKAEALYVAPPAPAADPAVAPAGAVAPTGAVAGDVSTGGGAVTAEPVQIVFVWEGISTLYQSFFSDPEIVTDLAAGFAGEVRGPANVYVRYDSEHHRGSIRLQVRPDTLPRPPRRTGDTIALQDLAPLTTALATYRSSAASRKDLRLESFKVGLESFRGARSCIFQVAGTPPPDGRLVSPCVQINGKDRCGDPGPVGVTFPADAADDIAACLDL